jgi:alpha-N-arabinofuranosidase
MVKRNAFSSLVLTLLFSAAALVAQSVNTLTVRTDQGKGVISKHIYGHFSEHLGHCIYGGYWVGENSNIPNTRGIRNDVVQALRDLAIPNLRWPGGCFADEYHWKDGIGPRNQRPTMINTHWGGVTEDNAFGTHEFMDLCEQLGTEPYITGNVGSGEVSEMSQWVEYINSGNISPMTDLRKKNGREKPWNLKYWGVGNENWGCGGNMTPEYYADVMRRYSTFCRNFGDNRLIRIACGPNSEDYNWTEVLMKEPENRRMMQGLSLHYYTVCHDWGSWGSATKFNESEWFTTMKRTLKMEEMIRKHSAIMDKYDPERRIGLMVDEWGNWHDVEPGTNPGFLYQQNTLRDALVAAINLDIFNNHCDRVKMANIAQTVNVLQAMILTQDKDMVLTPSYYVFKMYKVHHDATLLPTEVKSGRCISGKDTVEAVRCSASKDAQGLIHLSLTNVETKMPVEMTCTFEGLKSVQDVSGEVLTAEKITSFNDFGKQEEVHPKAFHDFKKKGNAVIVRLPAKSVVVLTVK